MKFKQIQCIETKPGSLEKRACGNISAKQYVVASCKCSAVLYQNRYRTSVIQQKSRTYKFYYVMQISKCFILQIMQYDKSDNLFL